MSNIAIFAPAPIRGSGGVARIYSFADALNSVGHKCDIYVFDSCDKTASSIAKDAEAFYSVKNVTVICGTSLNNEYELLIATRWDTAKIIRDLPSNKKAYLVQDFEAYFNPVGDASILAENSYLYGFHTFTYGRWLALKLYTEYGNSPYYCDFSTNLNTFHVTQSITERLDENPKICFIYQHDKPRRCPQLGIEALGIVKHVRPDVEIVFVGSDVAPDLWYEYTNVGILSPSKLNDLYNSCHVGFCLSSSNPSCNPFDMMAAGLPSIDLYRENNLFDIPGEGVLLAHQTPESLAEAILHLISSKEILMKMSKFGVDFMKNRSSNNEVHEFISAINKILSGVNHDFDVSEATKNRYTKKAVVADVYVNESVINHISSQMDNYYRATERLLTNKQNELAYESHRFVTEMNREKEYPQKQTRQILRRVKNLVKKLIK